MKRIFSRRRFKDLFQRYHSYFLVVAIAAVLLGTLTFFVSKMAALPEELDKIKLSFENDFKLEALLCLFLPIVFLALLFKHNMEKNAADVMMALPVKRSADLASNLTMLVVFFLEFSLIGIATDFVLGRYASKGFVNKSFLLTKYGLLFSFFILGIGVGLLVVSAVTGMLELVLYGIAMSIIVLGLHWGMLCYYFDKIVGYGEHFVLELLFSYDASFPGYIYEDMGIRLEDPIYRRGMLVATGLLAVVILFLGVIAALKRPAERSGGSVRCRWIRFTVQLALTVAVLRRVVLADIVYDIYFKRNFFANAELNRTRLITVLLIGAGCCAWELYRGRKCKRIFSALGAVLGGCLIVFLMAWVLKVSYADKVKEDESLMRPAIEYGEQVSSYE